MNYMITRREKMAIAAAAAVLGIFIVSRFIVYPYTEKHRKLTQQITHHHKQYLEALVQKSEYEKIKKMADDAKNRSKDREKGFTLFSFLDKLAGKTGLKDHIVYMKPSASDREEGPFRISTVETKLQGLTMEMLTKYIYHVETSKNMVNLKKLSIKKTGKQAGFIDAILLVETFEKKS